MADIPRIVRILVVPARGEPMRDIEQVEAVPGRGLRGDRYFEGRGTFSGRRGIYAGAREVSIIDEAAIRTCCERLDMPLDAAVFRRNLVVAGLDLRALLHADLVTGDVRLHVVSTCPPCSFLARQVGVDVKAGLKRIGGVRARVIDAGTLHADAAIGPVPGDVSRRR